MTPSQSIRTKLIALAACALAAASPLAAQSPRQAAPIAKASATIPALFLSDIHFDPYADPALVARLDAASPDKWKAILSTPASVTQEADAAALNKAGEKIYNSRHDWFRPPTLSQ